MLPAGVERLYGQVPVHQRNPGLELDKFTRPRTEQKDQKDDLEAVCRAGRSDALLGQLRKRRDRALKELPAFTTFRARTTGPLTLHLAREAALENAGLYLHPLYGFCCLPATGLKGMTRAWAETVWLEEQPGAERAAAEARIDEVFGPTTGEAASAGAVVFHDAWPTAWPELVVDITNNHHTKYYAGNADPEDNEDPIPVTFLAIGAGVEFRLVLTTRQDGTDTELVTNAADWLAAALVHAGAGAKTNAGYGRFKLLEQPAPPAPRTARRVSTHELELVTPAFLAGADQQDPSGCELRPSTLRGHLRWWWRTMHASHLGRDDLRALEAAIWGSTEQGGALSLAVERTGEQARVQQFAASTRQPLFYAAYGMAESRRGAGDARSQVLPPATWLVTLSARSSTVADKNGGGLDAQQILKQGEAALWLLARYGAVGAKSRKGFGSFRDLEMEFSSRDDCLKVAEACRTDARLTRFGEVRSSSLNEALFFEIETSWPSSNHEVAMNKVAAVYQELVKGTLPKQDRRVFGLPRNQRGIPVSRNEPKRYASPLHWSLSTTPNGTFRVRMTAFPAPVPDVQTSTRVLKDTLDRAERHTAWRQTPSARPRRRSHGRRGPRSPERGPVRHPFLAAPTSRQSFRQSGQRLRVVLVEKRIKKRGRFTWFAQDEESGRKGAIVNSALVPEEAEPGLTAEVVLASENAHQIQFRWPEFRGRSAKRKGDHSTRKRR